MLGYLIDVENGRHGRVEIDDSDRLGHFYRLIGCRGIDIAVRTIGGKPFNVVVDDEGLLKSDPVTSAIDACQRDMLWGNLVILGMDRDDMDLASLSDNDVRLIRKNLMLAIDTGREKIYAVAVMGYL